MTPDEAIEELKNANARLTAVSNPKLKQAIQLGIEALERLKELRCEENPHRSFNPLGGKTQLLHDAWEEGRKRVVALLPSETES